MSKITVKRPTNNLKGRSWYVCIHCGRVYLSNWDKCVSTHRDYYDDIRPIPHNVESITIDIEEK